MSTSPKTYKNGPKLRTQYQPPTEEKESPGDYSKYYKFRWSKEISNKSVCFKIQKDRSTVTTSTGVNMVQGDGDSLAQKDVVQPFIAKEYKSIYPKFMFLRHMTDSIPLADENSSSHVNFFNESLECANPTHAAEPFFLFGIDLCCVRSLTDILVRESIEEAEYVVVEPNPVVIDVSQFLRVVTSRVKKRRHYLARVLEGLLTRTHTDVDVTAFCDKYVGTNGPVTDLWKFLVHKCDWVHSMHGIYDELLQLKEKDLESLLLFLLRLDGDCFPGCSITIKQFKCTYDRKGKGIQCNPDLIYALVKLGLPEIASLIVTVAIEGKSPKKASCFSDMLDDLSSDERDKDGDDGIAEIEREMINLCLRIDDWIIVHIHSEVLWLVFEQVYGMLMKTKHDTTGKKIVCQSGVIVNNDTVRVVVLAVDVETFEEMRLLDSALDTCRHLLDNYAKKSKMWCRFYVDSQKHHVSNIATVAKSCYVNFCRCF